MFRVSSHGSIRRIRMLRRLPAGLRLEVSAYLVDGLLIDTGGPAVVREFLAWCRGQEIERVAITHHHEDHVGGAAALIEELGLEVLAPAAGVAMMAEGLRIPLFRRLFWGYPRPFQARPLGGLLEHRNYRLQVIPTPGHAIDHVCLFEEDRRWLFSGDLFVHPRVRHLRRVEDVGAHLDSLHRVRALEPELLICSHAGVIEDARGALDEKIAFWEDLGEEVCKLSGQGLTEKRITRRLLGREGWPTYLSFGDFSKRNLVRSFLGRSSRLGGETRVMLL